MWRTYIVWVYKKMSIKCEEHVVWVYKKMSLKYEEHMSCESTTKCLSSVKNTCLVCKEEDVPQVWRTYVVWVYKKMSLKCEKHVLWVYKNIAKAWKTCRVSLQEDLP